MALPNTQLTIDLMNLCIKHKLVEYVFVAWGDDDAITVAANAKDQVTWPMQQIFEYANEVAKAIQNQSKNRKQ